MPQKLVSCTKKVKAQLRKLHPSWSDTRIDRAARGICVQRTGQKFRKDSNYSLPDGLRIFAESNGIVFTEDGIISGITYNAEIATDGMDFDEKLHGHKDDPLLKKETTDTVMGSGTALYPVLSRNFTRYLKSEIEKASSSLRDVPFQKDHSDSVNDNFGRIRKEIFDPKSGMLDYIAELDEADKVTVNMKRKFIKNVSVKLTAKIVECSICSERMGWFHEHIPGFEYEDDKGKKRIAEAVPRDFRFIHVGAVTAPGVTKADINIHQSESEGSNIRDNLDDLLIDGITEAHEPYYEVFSESFGDKRNMSNNDEHWKEKLEQERIVLENKNKAQELEQKENELKEREEALKTELANKVSAEKEALVDELVQAEISLKKIKENESKVRKAELMAESQIDYLKGMKEVYKEYLVRQGPASPNKPKSKLFDVGDDESGTSEESLSPDKRKLTGRKLREAQIEFYGRQMFGEEWNQSWSAVKTLDDWDHQRSDWDRPLRDTIRSIR
ncbi:MAG: hypothetical protein ACW99F_15910 [Candidatus Hodarchaeales archaeon]